jgi:hypothetical protein
MFQTADNHFLAQGRRRVVKSGSTWRRGRGLENEDWGSYGFDKNLVLAVLMCAIHGTGCPDPDKEAKTLANERGGGACSTSVVYYLSYTLNRTSFFLSNLISLD